MLAGVLRDDREWPHHVVIFVLDNVTMVDVGLGRTHAGEQIVFRTDSG
jgi:hypothetical protein